MTDTATEPRPARQASGPPPEEAERPLLRRWSQDLSMGMRFAFAGGRESWIRTLLSAGGIGLGVMVLFLAAAIPSVGMAQDARKSDRTPVTNEVGTAGPDDLLYASTTTSFRGTTVWTYVLEPLSGSSPVPPGLEELPGPGEVLVSPALGRILDSADGALLAPRVPGEVVGEVGAEGLEHPTELLMYVGSDTLRDGPEGVMELYSVSEFGLLGDGSPLDPVLLLLATVVCVVLLLPVGAFVATAVRLGGERRDRRLAALRLVGADIPTTHRIAAGESLAGALLGLLTGALLFWLARAAFGGREVMGHAVYRDDLVPQPLIVVLVVVAVPAAAVLIAMATLRRIAVEPLGVVRDAVPRRRRIWWRLLLPLLGVALLVPHIGGVGPETVDFPVWQIVGGIALLLGGATVVLPWLVETAVRRLRGGPLPLQLAVRRLQLDSGPAVRAVSGITIAVAGAITAATFFAGVSGNYTEETGLISGTADVYAEAGSAANGQALFEAVAAIEGAEVIAGAVRFGATQAHTGVELQALEDRRLAVMDCATVERLTRVTGCVDGQVFRSPVGWNTQEEGEEALPELQPGDTLDLAPPAERYWPGDVDGPDPGTAVPATAAAWTVPAEVLPAELREDEGRYTVNLAADLLVTPAALDLASVREAWTEMHVEADSAVPDVLEHVRNAVYPLDPAAFVAENRAEQEEAQFTTVKQAMFGGAAGMLLVIAASLVVVTVEQLRERRKLLSVLVAFGTRRATLGWSVLWQTALPVVLGMAMALAAGLTLGLLLQSIAGLPLSVDWSAVLLVLGLGLAMTAVTTLLALPPLWRMMRPRGLRTE